VAERGGGLANALVAAGVSAVKYGSEKPALAVEEDGKIGATKLGIRPRRSG
jgi:hypothetical protein